MSPLDGRVQGNTYYISHLNDPNKAWNTKILDWNATTDKNVNFITIIVPSKRVTYFPSDVRDRILLFYFSKFSKLINNTFTVHTSK